MYCQSLSAPFATSSITSAPIEESPDDGKIGECDDLLTCYRIRHLRPCQHVNRSNMSTMAPHPFLSKGTFFHPRMSSYRKRTMVMMCLLCAPRRIPEEIWEAPGQLDVETQGCDGDD